MAKEPNSISLEFVFIFNIEILYNTEYKLEKKADLLSLNFNSAFDFTTNPTLENAQSIFLVFIQTITIHFSGFQQFLFFLFFSNLIEYFLNKL